MERQALKPAQLVRQGAHASHNDQRGTAYPHRGRPLRKRPQRSAAPPLPGEGSPLHHGGGGVRVHPGRQQSAHNSGQRRHAHEEHQCPPGAHKGLEVDVRDAALPGVTGDNVQRRGVVPVGHRDPPVGRRRNSGGHAGDLLEVQPRPGQGLQLLAAPAKDEGVSPLQPHHAVSRLGLLQQNLVDLRLGHRVAPGLLAHVDPPGGGGDHLQNGGAHQPVIDHHLRSLQGLPPLDRQQSRVPRTRADQRYLSCHPFPSFSFIASSSASAAPSAGGPVTAPLRICSFSSTYNPVTVMTPPSSTA